jgi:hypothetical protein
MNKSILFFLIFGILNLFFSCSKDSETNTPIVYPRTEAKINSFSKNYGYTGESISIYGENFTDKINDVSIKFDEIPATIVSVTYTEIKCILPASAKVIPKLNLNIQNRNITNLVVNDYDSNIGILPSVTLNSWIAFENSLKSSNVINRVQMTSNQSVYYTMGSGIGNVVYRTIDNGISWKLWSSCGFDYSAFQATNNDDGWAYTGFGLKKVPVGGSSYIDHIWVGPYITSMYVNQTLNQGTCISNYGVVNITNDGVNFSEVYSSSIFNIPTFEIGAGFLYNSFEIDNNHMWSIGYKRVRFLDFTSTILKPMILYKNNTTDGWKENVITVAEDNSFAKQIQFFLSNIGYVLIHKYDNSVLVSSKIYKSTNGGDTWTSTENNEKFTHFTFKDENTGWAIVENKIYKTINGGISWQLDYTHDQNFRNISYKDNVVWAFSTDKILKYLIR